MRKTYSDTKGGAADLIRDIADEDLAAEIEQAVAKGDAWWIPDPEVPMVWGLKGGIDDAILAVVYLEYNDFEISTAGDSFFTV